jgi:predicted aspartyl protease
LADGSLHVFDVYICMLTWNGQARTVEVDEAETDPLVGMRLLRDHNLSVDVVDNGKVRIEALARFSPSIAGHAEIGQHRRTGVNSGAMA